MNSQRIKSPFKMDIVGSFLRPEVLLKAREDYKEGIIDTEQLKEIEDEAIRQLIHKQKEAGLSVITDGEFRRSSWHLDFMWAFNGVAHKATQTGIPFHGEAAMIDDTYLEGPLSIERHPFVDHFAYVKSFEEEGIIARQTIPAPAQFFFQMISSGNLESTRRYYSTDEALMEAIGEVYRQVIHDLYEEGCRSIQLDDCTWGVCVDPNACAILETDEAGLQKRIHQLIQVNNLAIQGKPEDLVITTHICRGNFHSTWACQGGYDAVANPLFREEKVDAFYLEFDDERSGGFEPLQYVGEDKSVVLGLVTTKKASLEDKDALITRIHEASRYIPLERLALSPQCGFASTHEGNDLTQEEQWAKVQLVREVAKEVWGS